jgi:hypothetical protein
MPVFIEEPPFFQISGEAGNRRRLGIEGLKHTGEFRDDQQILQTIAEMEQLDAPAHPLQGCIAGDKLTQPTAIHVFDSRQVNDQLTGSGVNGASDMLSELRIAFQSEVTFEIQNCDVV